MCTAGRTQEAGIYTTDADIQPLRNPTNTKQLVMTCPILKRPADCTRPGPSRLSFTPKPRPKQCVGELEIPGLPSTARTLFSGLRVSTHGKQAGPLVGFYHSAGRQPANSTPRPAGGRKKVVPELRQEVKVKVDIVTSDDIKIYNTGKFQDFTVRYIINVFTG